MSAVSIRSVHKHYGRVHALKGVDFRIERGEFFGLLGPNGAGKSTLINAMAGLTRIDSGSISVLGHDVMRDFRQSRRVLGVVPQELVFDPFFSVREVLRIQAGYFGYGRESESWREELLHALMLEDKADVNMRALSGGMKRRVLIAQALVHKPEVVVLDEPTAGVDVELRHSLWTFVQRLHREGRTIVLTTHYLDEAEALCDRIGILNQGRLVALDSKQRLLARDIGTKLRITLAQPIVLPPPLSGRLTPLEGNSYEAEFDRHGGSLFEVLDALRAAGAVITEIHTEEKDLEDIFMEMTRR